MAHIMPIHKQEYPNPHLYCPQCNHTLRYDLQPEIDSQSFSKYFQSWFIPNSEEESRIREDLKVVEAHRMRLGEERQALQEVLKQMDNELTKLEKITAGLKSAFSNTRRIPTEILQLVFELAIPQDSEDDQRLTIWSESPWTVSEVCHRWRQIAISTPTLWTNVYLPSCYPHEFPHGRGHPDRSRNRRIIELSIERSQELPLNLILKSCPRRLAHVAHDRDVEGCYACSLVIELSSRIRHINYEKTYAPLWIAELPPSFSQLYSMSGFLDHSSPFFSHAPMLKAADIYSSDRLSSYQLPLAQLTYLNLNGLVGSDGGSLLQILQQCGELVFFGLHINGSLHTGSFSNELPLAILPKLRVLHVIYERRQLFMLSSLPELIKQLRCPHLESLTLNAGPEELEACIRLVVESRCQGTLADLFVGMAARRDISGDSFQSLIRLLEETENIESLALFTTMGKRIFLDLSSMAELCALLNRRVRNIESIRIVQVDDRHLVRPATYIGTAAQLFRNSFAYYLHQRWTDSPVAQQGEVATPSPPERRLPQIYFPDFVHEPVPADVVKHSGVKYICMF